MKAMKTSNKQDEVSREGGKCSHSSHPDGSGDYVRLWGLCEISIRTDISFTLTHHAMSGIFVRFWRAISKKSP